MNELANEIRARVDSLELELRVMDLPPNARRRVRRRQLLAATTGMAIVVATVLGAALVPTLHIGHRVPQSRPASRVPVSKRLHPLADGQTTGVLATFDVDGDTYTLQVGDRTGTTELELLGPGANPDVAAFPLPAAGHLAVQTWSRSFSTGAVIAGLAPVGAATVRVAASDGRSLTATIYELPSSYTTEFEAFAVVMPAPLSQFSATAYDARGNALTTEWNPIATAPPTTG